jgi:histidyl-tRNA synthetase
MHHGVPLKFKSIKGTRDILPGESSRWQHVESVIRSVMQRFNFREIRTPIFEETALFARGIGELTDIVSKEMYTFQDRSGTSVTLRPEMTAPVIRSYIQNNLGEQQSLVKVFYIAPMFRQERPQAGRLRQFHQLGAEAIGGTSPRIDAEIITLASEIYRTLGLKNFSTRINSVGCSDCRPRYKDILREFLSGVLDKLSEESRRRFDQNPLRILDSKDERDKEYTASAPLIKDHLCEACAKHFEELLSCLNSLGVGYEIDGRIVRGLDYYTRTAFEIVSTDLGSQDALAGGGRYDLLVQELGGAPTPSVGYAGGIERLLMVLEKIDAGAIPEIRPQVFIAAADDQGRDWAMTQALEFRRAGIRCEIDHLGRSLKAQMREADRQGAAYVCVVGAREIEERRVSIKPMNGGEPKSVSFDQLTGELLSATA